MKSKKLFAIVTLVMFMMTLLPMVAFAVAYSASASYITTDKTSVATSEAGIERVIKLTLVARDSAGGAIISQDLDNVYLKSDNDAVKVGVLLANAQIAADDVDTTERTLSTANKVYFVDNATSATGAKMSLKTDANGRVVFYVYSRIGGEANLAFYNLQANNDGKTAIGSAKLSFTASAATIAGIKFTQAPAAGAAGTEMTIKAQVYDSSNNGVENQSVTFYAKKGTAGSFVTIGTVTTDDIGEASLKYTPTEAADYTIKVKSGSKEATAAAVTISAAGPISLEARTASAYAEKGQAYKAQFYATDIYGNKIKNASLVTFKCSDAPTDSGQKNTDLTDVGYNSTNKTVYAKFTPNINGEYTIKAQIPATGISATMKITAGAYGTVTSVKVKLASDDDIAIKSKNLAAGADRDNLGNTNALRVLLVDENGLEKTATDADVVLTTSDPSLIKFTAFGEARGPVNNSKGVATVTAVHKDTGLTGSLDIKVVGGPAAIKETVTVNDKRATVALQMVDSDGNNTFYGADQDYTVVVPAGVTIVSETVVDDTKGTGTFVIDAAEYGEKTVTVIMPDGLAKTITVTFGAPAPVIEGAASSVTMFIGATGYVQDGVAKVMDIAPFIQDGRTFVAVRYLAEAFGATVEWNEATQTVTMTRSDMTLTVVIGSSTITKVADGVTTTVVADVPAFITEGRTVLPFRAVGEAFGYTVAYDAATQAVSYSL